MITVNCYTECFVAREHGAIRMYVVYGPEKQRKILRDHILQSHFYFLFSVDATVFIPCLSTTQLILH